MIINFVMRLAQVKFLLKMILFFLLKLYVYMCCVYMFMYMGAVPMKSRRGCWIPWSWTYRELNSCSLQEQYTASNCYVLPP